MTLGPHPHPPPRVGVGLASQRARPTRVTRRRHGFGAGVAVAVLLALGACSGGAEDDGVASAGGEVDPAAAEGTEPIDEELQALAFAECMRGNGVDMPDPAPGQRGLSDALHGVEEDYDQATIDEALAACEDLSPQRAHEDDAAHDQERSEMMLDLADCLRDQGLDVPDNLQEHDVEDDELRSAMQECREVVAAGDHG